MTGWLYRRAAAIRELGERRKIRALVIFGLWLRDKAVTGTIKTL
jgi:hypothetical protein